MADSETSEVSSVLSKGQREWLKGNDEALGSPDRVIRSRIRERYKQAISDLALLYRSDEFSSDELMKAVRDHNTSGDDKFASEGDIQQEAIGQYLHGAFGQLETVMGKEIEEIEPEDLLDQNAKAAESLSKQIDEKYIPRLAVHGATLGLKATGKTDKQVRQWIENHWPSTDVALDLLEKNRESSRF